MEVNGYNFKVVDQGSGDPVVFVHGSISDWRTWKRPLETFGQSYHAIAYSRRFHWPNEEIPEGADYSFLQHVEDLHEILKSLGKPVHLIGHSYGALVSLFLAIKAPDLLKTLVLMEPPALTLFVSNTPKPLEILKLLFSRPKTAFALIQFGAKGWKPAKKAAKNNDFNRAIEIFGTAVLGEEAYLNMPPTRKEQVKDNFFRAEFTGSGFPPLDEEKVKGIQVPTLLLTGAKTRPFFLVLTDRLEELIPNTTRIKIANASHNIHEDNPKDFEQVVLAFLEKHG
ncbi:alpha/beta hydrolase [Echinicola jeungdonensis]|uniref:Alpha/beta fold hydrolase n=1 Tax=Echinicola jeungdonensis TaxID=709343 RepID=A0ABV5J8M3_9BACT|nr:alpha/beta hydrolase [Echinicola jeungdonensis]MDN3669392.1 alpha/beta hydrolase [Echinicola jeungdonensis]